MSMSLATQKSQAVSEGVENLITKLREDGVEQGRAEANKIVEAAKKQAAQEVARAKKEADAYYDKRRGEIESLEQALSEDMRVIFRDNLLKMQERF